MDAAAAAANPPALKEFDRWRRRREYLLGEREKGGDHMLLAAFSNFQVSREENRVTTQMNLYPEWKGITPWDGDYVKSFESLRRRSLFGQ